MKKKDPVEKILVKDRALFLFQFLRNPYDIGALTPSSKALGETMTRFVKADTGNPMRYLEVGAGTGPFTRAIVKKLGPDDILDVIEINADFCESLKKQYADNSNITIHSGSILHWSPPYQYDVIVSSLPFKAFSADLVSQILSHYQQLAKPNAVLSYFEYRGLSKIKNFFLKNAAKEAFKKTLLITQQFESEHEFRQDKVFANFPPALVHHCRFTKIS